MLTDIAAARLLLATLPDDQLRAAAGGWLDELEAARAEIARLSSTWIGTLLDAWEQVPNDAKTDEWRHVDNLLAQLAWEVEQYRAPKEPPRG